jgi:predicted nucleotidyltransferase
MKLDIENLVIEFSAARYLGNLAVLLFGSHARGNAGANSDVDLIVVFDKPIAPYREKVKFSGLLFDVLVYDKEALNGAIHSARLSGSWVLISAIRTAKVLPIDCPATKLLKINAERLQKAGPLIRSLDNDRQLITGMIDDLEACTDAAERTSLCVELYKAIMDALMTMHGSGGSSRREAVRTMKSKDEKLLRTMQEHFCSTVTGENMKFIALASAILSRLGGPLREGFHSQLPEAIRIPLIE